MTDLASITSGGTTSAEGSDLEATLWRLVAGEVELSDLTPALAGWWAVAFAEGQKAAVPPDLARLEFEVAYWRFRATNPGKDFYGAMTDELWRAGL